LDARGVSGPDLTITLATGTNEERFSRIVRGGLGTEMPSFRAEQTTDAQVGEILAYLQSLTRGAASEPVRGNSANGATIFERRCASCHKVNGKGGSLGPDLSRIGAIRSASALASKIRDPNRNFARGFRPVTVVLADSRRVRGVVKNQDAFSIQIMDVSERLLGFSTDQLREVVFEERSLMPVFAPAALSESALNDLVSYLATLRGAGAVPGR
jgi:putative heme-binding domain-containing protein